MQQDVSKCLIDSTSKMITLVFSGFVRSSSCSVSKVYKVRANVRDVIGRNGCVL